MHAGAAYTLLPTLIDAVKGAPSERPGSRLRDLSSLADVLASQGVLGVVPAARLGPSCRPVRAILFDKNETTNWALGWHQDRTICVTERRDIPGFGPWSIKQGLQHVEPPFSVIQAMLTIRIHLDDVPPTNAPLLIARGSHRFGKQREDQIAKAVQRCAIHECVATAGDVWLYATSILHSSRAATDPCRRRVLQIDYSSQELPGGLDWLGV